MPLIEKRYAEAFIDISVSKNLLDEYENQFRSVVDIYNTQEDFRQFIVNPEVHLGVKKDFIKKVFSGKVNDDLVNFMLLLLDKGRIKYFPGILEEFTSIADSKRNVLSLTITSAAKLEEAQINKLVEKYKAIYNPSSVKVNIEIDKSLVGGVRVQIGDKVTDGSIKGRLEALRQELLG